MKVLAALADRTGCGWYRMLNPLGTAEKQGRMEVTWGGKHDIRDYDILVGQRVSNESTHAEWMRLAAHKDRRYRLVLELDDDLWSVEQSNEPAWDFYRARDPRRLGRLRECVEVADMVTTTTEPLARVLRAMTGAPVAVLPNCVDEAMLKIERKPCEALTVGFGGSASHAGDWAYEGKGIGEWLRRNQGARMHFVGAAFPQHLPGTVIGGGQVFRSDWSDDLAHYHQSLEMDVGVAPLRDTKFNKSKSALKLLEYWALGIPAVVSDVPAYRGHVRDGRDGFICATDKQWVVALDALRDEGRRAEVAAAGRRKAGGHLIQNRARLWAEAYRRALEAPPRA